MTYKLILTVVLIALLSACSTNKPDVVPDAQGRVIRKSDKDTGEVTEWEYDRKGRVSTVKSSEGTVRHLYNSKGLLTKVENLSDNSAWEFKYTDDGKLKTVKDPAGNAIGYVYDKDGTLIKKILPDGTVKKDPKPPADPLTLIQQQKPEYDKRGQPDRINNMTTTVNSYQ